jgi:chemotaxis signal transduction protein
LFSRGARTYAAPVQLLAQVLDRPAVFPVPLAPSAHRGLLYHGRAIHPVFDLPILYGDPAPEGAATALLIEAGGNAIAVLADRILPAGVAVGREVSRPSWDLLFTGS